MQVNEQQQQQNAPKKLTLLKCQITSSASIKQTILQNSKTTKDIKTLKIIDFLAKTKWQLIDFQNNQDNLSLNTKIFRLNANAGQKN